MSDSIGRIIAERDELVRIRHGEAAAAEAQAVLDGLELEAPPEVASQQRDFFSMLAA